MIRKYHNHTPHTTPRHLEEEPFNHHESKDTDGVLLPCNRGQRLIVDHAGSEDVFIPGARLIYKVALYTGDYHNEMNAKNFTKWLEKMLLPNLDGPSAIVMDIPAIIQCSPTSVQQSNTRKADIQVLTKEKNPVSNLYLCISSLSLLVFKYI